MHQPVESRIQTGGEGRAIHILQPLSRVAQKGLKVDKKRASIFFILTAKAET